MAISATESIMIIAVCTACTFLERALPFIIFRGREVPDIVRYLGRVLPMAIMATLVIYCIKGISSASMGGWVPIVIASAATVVLHLWKGNTMLSIFGGTVCYMVLVQMVFV